MKKIEDARPCHAGECDTATSNKKLELKHEILDADSRQSAAEERLGRMF